MFLSVMLWFILDSKKAPTVFVDGDRVYAVRNVFEANQTTINCDCDEEEDPEEVELEVVANEQSSTMFSNVSRRMILQFFADEEGPDRDWS